MERLIDLGERRILAEIIPQYVHDSGDDCAIIDIQYPTLAITTDPVPVPAAHLIGGDSDPYFIGWLLVTINVSDLAAAAATPLGLVAALELPNELPVADLHRLLQGVRDSCEANRIRFVGGNLKEADKIAATATAVGGVYKAVRRTGAQAGDSLYCVGRGGAFWSDAFDVYAGKSVRREVSPLFVPISQAQSMSHFASKGFVQAAMDSSDGLIPSLEELGAKNGLRVELDLVQIRGASSALSTQLDPVRYWLGWGDWIVLAAVRPENQLAFVEEASKINHPVVKVGQFSKGAGVLLIDDGRERYAERLESERFAKDSWFSSGLQGYVQLLRDYPLP